MEEVDVTDLDKEVRPHRAALRTVAKGATGHLTPTWPWAQDVAYLGLNSFSGLILFMVSLVQMTLPHKMNIAVKIYLKELYWELQMSKEDLQMSSSAVQTTREGFMQTKSVLPGEHKRGHYIIHSNTQTPSSVSNIWGNSCVLPRVFSSSSPVFFFFFSA